MGHGSKKMVYEVYGDYIEGLEQDAWKILEYFGRDFIETKGQRPPHHLGYPSGWFLLPFSVLTILQGVKRKTPTLITALLVKALVKVGVIFPES